MPNDPKNSRICINLRGVSMRTSTQFGTISPRGTEYPPAVPEVFSSSPYPELPACPASPTLNKRFSASYDMELADAEARELGLKSIELMSDDESDNETEAQSSNFFIRERGYCPPSSQGIIPTPYFDLILRSFEEAEI